MAPDPAAANGLSPDSLPIAVQGVPMRYRVRGMDCADCARTLQKAVAGLPGVDDARVNFGAATLTVTPAATRPVAAIDIAVTADRAGFEVTLEQGRQPALADQITWWRDVRLRWVLVAAALWVVGMALQLAHVSTLPDLAFGAAILLAGWPFARAALQSLRARRLDMNVLMTTSVIGAAALGEWGEGAAVIVLFAVGGALQERTLERTRGAIRSLMAIAPATASRIDASGQETVVPVEALRVDDLVRVRPGERLPADGLVVEGISAVDQSPITGESIPTDKSTGDACYAGTMNGSGALLLRVSRAASDSTLARIITLVEEAQGSRAHQQQLVDRFAAVYTPLVILGAVLLAVVGSWITQETSTWVYRALALLVIACPCALVISTPVSIVSAIGEATRRGILIKGGAALETAGRAQVVALDKTGTLTAGRPIVTEVVCLSPDLDARSLLSLAASVEACSEHPLARAVLAHAHLASAELVLAKNFQAIPGKGAYATIAGDEVAVGSLRLARELGLATGDGTPEPLRQEMQRLAAAGATPLFVARRAGNRWQPLGVIAVADAVRPHAAAAIQRLRAAGVQRVVVLTGDTRASGEAVARAVGADEAMTELLPQDKAAAVAALRERYGPVVMVGDGVNDAPALAAADVGVAMGAAGTDVALETADIALMGDDLNGLADALVLSRRTSRVIKQNVTFSFLIKLFALVLAVFGFVSLWIAVLADVGASLIVTANGLRLSRGGRR
ncbi:MAG: cation-translocating P-type ATPase [Chloroflexia bacterium]|nr:cation-translocating P-type ATPase [Chloroflexia bacterium]